MLEEGNPIDISGVGKRDKINTLLKEGDPILTPAPQELDFADLGVFVAGFHNDIGGVLS